MNISYKKAILGGTFDHFHLGHQKLIDTAFEQSEHVTIGLAQPSLYKSKFLSELIEPYEKRKESLENYLEEKQLISRATIIPIENIYGNTLEEKNLDAIFATEENEKNINLINAKRQDQDFPALQVIIVVYVMADDHTKITSERIRKGEIDSKGFVYKSIFENKESLILPESLREELQKPFGKIVQETADVLKLLTDKSIVVAVGDIIVSSLQAAGFRPSVSIIDLRTRRHEITTTSHHTGLRAKNDQGTINTAAVLTFENALHNYLNTGKQQTIVVDGEEDLLALPAILLAPLDSIVLYGQFDQGVVLNNVTETLKKKIQMLLTKFHE